MSRELGHLQMTNVAQRRSQRLAAYDELRSERPHLFKNPPNAAYEILFEEEDQ